MVKRNAAVEATLTLPGITRPVGRPRKADALSNAQRQKAFRDRNKAPAGDTAISVTGNEKSPVAIALSVKQFEVLQYLASCNYSAPLGGTGQIGRLNSGLSLVRLGFVVRNAPWGGFSVTKEGRQYIEAQKSLASNEN